MVVGPAPISKVANLGVDVFINHWTCHINHLLLAELDISRIFIFFVVGVNSIKLTCLKPLLAFLDLSSHVDVLLNLVAKIPLKIENIIVADFRFLRIVLGIERIVFFLLKKKIWQAVRARPLPLKILLILVHEKQLLVSGLRPIVH